MYAVQAGHVDLLYNGRVLESLGPGDVVGIAAVLDDAPHVTSAIAVIDCEIATVDKKQFLFLVHETPMFALHIMRTMNRRMRLMAQVQHTS